MKFLLLTIFVCSSSIICEQETRNYNHGEVDDTQHSCGQCDVDIDGSCDCTKFMPRHSCLEFLQLDKLRVSGRYRLDINGKIKTVFCDQTELGGGWTVMQRRKNGYVNFRRNWNDYKVGFGELNGDMWVGNEVIHELTKAPSELLINMRMKNTSNMVYVKYADFSIGDEASNYKLRISGPSGNAPHLNGMIPENGEEFSTSDRDNDNFPGSHCAKSYGGWWFDYCYRETSLNGIYQFGDEYYFRSIYWHYTSRMQPEFVEMKIRKQLLR